MKYVIDSKVCEKHNLPLSSVLAMLLVKSCEGEVADTINNLLEEQKLVEGEAEIPEICNKLFVTQRWDDEVCSILLESDKSVPQNDRLENLVTQMRELFPTGMKIGSSAWRGNKRELKLKMQKFFKLYGDYSDEDILSATKKYVDSFNGNYTYMRILKYFILKSEVKPHLDENGRIVNQVEDVSELANMLDNPEEALASRSRLI